MKVKCDNCGWIGDYDEAKPAEKLSMRIDIGGTYTDVECPDEDCGALCYPVEEVTEIWVCPDCGSEDVEEGRWVNVNTGEVAGGVSDDDYYCNKCETHMNHLDERKPAWTPGLEIPKHERSN